MGLADLLRFFQDNGIDFVLDTINASMMIEEKLEGLESCNSLIELRSIVENFEGCPLKKTALNTVFSDGDPNAKIMIIGEAPGCNEDKEGIPFCGRSGQLLNKMFEAIGISRSELYITNMVFWRPPGNRNPSNEEIAICKPFVEKHIAIIDPKIIVLAGSFATCNLLNVTQSVSKLRGALYPYKNRYMSHEIKAIPTFHPSYLLRQPKQKALAWKDLQMIQKYLLSIT